jgi:hypothetical protein
MPRASAGTGPWDPLGAAITDAKGMFRMKVPPMPSRTFRVVFGTGAGREVAADFDVRVQAQVTARARSPRVRNGRSAVIVGRVSGPLPPGGVMVALDVRDVRKWIPVATTKRWVRTRGNGSFELSYRFTRTFARTRYRFRAVVAEDSAFAYTRGVSRSIDVTVTP